MTMPNEPTSALLPVEQVDRDAAAAFTDMIGARTRGERAAMLNGHSDDDCYIQAFACHRIAHSPVDSGMSADAVERAELLWANLPTGKPWISLSTAEKALVCHTLARLEARPTPTDPEVAALVERECVECRGTGVAGRIGGYDRPCDVCAGDGVIEYTELENALLDEIEGLRQKLTRLSAKLQPSDMASDIGASLRDRAGHEPSPANGLGHPVTIASADKWRTDILPFMDRPIYQFVLLEGYQEHSGELWHRLWAGTAVISRENDSRWEYRREDIDRIQRDGDMVVVERVKAWMPATWPRWDFPAQGTEAGTAETERLSPKGDGPVAESHAPNPSHKDNPHG